MINFIKKINKNNIKKGVLKSPLQGRIVELSDIDDPVFSGEALGKSVAVYPEVGRILSPVDGKIVTVFDTKHAISIISDSGIEILIHIGIDTVKLEGKPFTVHVKNDQKVSAGDLLVEFNINEIESAKYSPVTLTIICNSNQYSEISKFQGSYVKEMEELISVI